MSIIPNKYLSTNLNRMNAEPGSLLKANNVRNDGGRLRLRHGQNLMIPQDPWGIANIPSYEGYKCVKIFFYNGTVFAYHKNQVDGVSDVISFFDRDQGVNGQWICESLANYSGDPNFNVDYQSIQPQFQESNNRLLFATKNGVFSSPKIDQKQSVQNKRLQLKMRPAGCPPALPFKLVYLVDTTASYAANWLESGSAVAYRHVWKYVDANGTAVYGAVSDRWSITNTDPSSVAIALNITIPLEIYNSSDASRFSCQVYRTISSVPSINGIAVDPGDEMFFVTQIRPTAAQKSAGLMSLFDIIDPIALQGPLYTNQTQQGAASSRIRPPICRTMADFAGAAWFGNITDRWSLNFELGGVQDPAATNKMGLRQGDIIVLGDRCFQAKATPVITKNQFKLSTAPFYTAQFYRIQQTLRSLQALYNADFSRPYYDLQTIFGPDDICGKMSLQETGNNVVPSQPNNVTTPYIGLYRASGWPSSAASDPCPISPTPLVTESKGKGFKIVRVRASGSTITFTLDSAPDFAIGDVVNLARPPVMYDGALAANSRGQTGDICYFTPGQYTVGTISGPDVTLDGVASLSTFDQRIGFDDGVNSRFLTTWTNLGAMHCVVQKSTLLTSAGVGQKNIRQNRVMYSPFYQPESAPALNYFDVGSSDKKIVRLIRLNKSLFVFKQDGLFRISGIYPDFVLQQFDPDIILLSPDLVCQMGGALYCMTTKGVYMVSQNNSQRISYDIQNQLDRILWTRQSDSQKHAFAVGHEQDHSVTFWLLNDNDSTTQPQLAFTFDGTGWTARTDMARTACVGQTTRLGNKQKYCLYTFKDYGSGWLTQQRKDLNGIGMCDQAIPAVITSIVDNYTFSATMTTDAGPFPVTTSRNQGLIDGVVIPLDAFGQPDFNMPAYITADAVGTGSAHRFTIEYPDNLGNYSIVDWPTSNCIIYLGIPAQWQYNIVGSQDIESRKHYTQVGFVFQQPYFVKADVGFASDVVPAQTWLNGNLAGFYDLGAGEQQIWPLMAQDDVLADKTLKALVDSSHARCSQLRVSVRHFRAMQFISCYGFFIRQNIGGKNIERTNGR